MTESEYFAHPALSASKINQILKCPYDYFNKVTYESKALDFGSEVHKLVLESDLKKLNDGRLVIVEPEFQDLRSKAGKAEREAFETKHANDYIVSKEAFECAETLLNSELSGFFRFEGIRETPFFGEVLGRDFKCKPDLFLPNFKYGNEDVNVCIDLKTCISNTERSFIQSIISYGYHVQAFIYSQILKADNFLFITIEKATYNIACFYLDSLWFDKAINDIKEAFNIIDNKNKYNKKIRVFKDESGDTTFIKKIELPNYLKLNKEII